MVYLPREDSYMLKKWVEKLAHGDVLDMGTGTGIQAFAAAPKAKRVIAVDANPEAIDYCNNAFHIFKNLEFRVSDLFSNVPEKFDVIIFNPPYLPESKYDKEIDTTGGKEGWETIEKFLKEAKKHLNKGGKILMVFSSFTNPKKVLEIAKELGYKEKMLEKKHFNFEDIFVYEFLI
jgi:release factor glutamine methyltransferase